MNSNAFACRVAEELHTSLWLAKWVEPDQESYWVNLLAEHNRGCLACALEVSS